MNIKNSKDSEGSSLKTGYSSAKPSKFEVDRYDNKAKPNLSGSEDENSRAGRLGKSETMSGPKSRTRNKDAKFFKMTSKGKK